MATPPTAAKVLENYLKDTFARPFLRRFRYLYFGLDHAPDVFVLSDTEDADFKYCEPMQVTGLIKVHDADRLAMVTGWFAQFGVHCDRPMLFYFGTWLTLMSKHPWDTPELTLTHHPTGVVTVSLGEQTDIIIARPVDVYFTLIKLQATVSHYQAVFFDHTQPSHDHSLVEHDPKHPIPLKLSAHALTQAEIFDAASADVSLVMIPGIEALVIKPLLKKDLAYSAGVKIWADASPRCLSYGGYFHNDQVSLCAARDNVFIFPCTKRTL